ncbi:hypothetical protein G7Y89_g8625 [Cudoniella acicularis]|uniref:Thioredoxin-like fold domain-containing protein n=1 Tax=Cudoniella acicularis TaxID=354080 RepID=A0A8H4RIU0_9HELO|nr:hypothetical protein G7Y89_g8625 [Cudoniella acicularis]
MSQTKPQQPQITLYRGWLDRGKRPPKGKIPYLELQTEGGEVEQIGDSTLIVKDLIERGVIPNINAEVSPVLQAQDLAIRALLEEKLYFYHTWERWTQNYYTMREHVLQALSYPMRVFIGLIIYRKTTATLNGQGTGHYSGEEIASFRKEIWESINALLTESKSKASRDEGKPFWVLGGERPTEADTTVFGFVVSVLICAAAPDSQEVVRGFPVVLEYASRIHDEYFPDYEKCL